MRPDQKLYTMRIAFEFICSGQRPWTALGNFMNAWWGYGKERREELICEPLSDDYPEKYHLWAAFCAASVDWFATTYDVSRPEWVDNPKYFLKTPWYFHEPKSLKRWLKKTTLPEFTKRNIFCGDTLYTNKWEYPLKRMKSKYRDAWDWSISPEEWERHAEEAKKKIKYPPRPKEEEALFQNVDALVEEVARKRRERREAAQAQLQEGISPPSSPPSE